MCTEKTPSEFRKESADARRHKNMDAYNRIVDKYREQIVEKLDKNDPIKDEELRRAGAFLQKVVVIDSVIANKEGKDPVPVLPVFDAEPSVPVDDTIRKLGPQGRTKLLKLAAGVTE